MHIFLTPKKKTMGALANVYAGIYLPTPLQQDISVEFTPESNECMNQTGNKAKMFIKKGDVGVQYVGIGTVERKHSGCKCLTSQAFWTLGYNVPDTPYSGSVRTQWNVHEAIILIDPGGTTVNTVPAKGNSTHVTWEGRADIYILFSPITDAIMQHLHLMWWVTPPENHGLIQELYKPLVEDWQFEGAKPEWLK
jgi:hypothetical protein